MGDLFNRTPGSQQLPPTVHASPSEVGPNPDEPDGEMVWWRPGWSDMLRHIGWYWLLLLPAAAVGALMIAAVLNPHVLGVFWWIGIKALVMIFAIPVLIFGHLAHQATKARTDPFCIHCGYTLLGLANEGRCPECGRPYNMRLVEEYRRDPQWFIARYKALGKLPTIQDPFPAGPPPSPGAPRRKRSKDGT